MSTIIYLVGRLAFGEWDVLGRIAPKVLMNTNISIYLVLALIDV